MIYYRWLDGWHQMMKADERYLAEVHSRQGQAWLSWTWSQSPGSRDTHGRPSSIYHRELDKEIQSSRWEEMRKSQTNTTFISNKIVGKLKLPWKVCDVSSAPTVQSRLAGTSWEVRQTETAGTVGTDQHAQHAQQAPHHHQHHHHPRLCDGGEARPEPLPGDRQWLQWLQWLH